jgi:hypothetical protein
MDNLKTKSTHTIHTHMRIHCPRVRGRIMPRGHHARRDADMCRAMLPAAAPAALLPVPCCQQLPLSERPCWQLTYMSASSSQVASMELRHHQLLAASHGCAL